MSKHRNGLPHGTVRRAPTGFAHAILLEQWDKDSWQVIDVYGPMDILSDEEVSHWPIVYTPVDDEEWKELHNG